MEKIELAPEVLNRFWAKVKKTKGCWIWTASLTPNGYGQCRFDGKNYRAHRLAYGLEFGMPAPTVQLDHICHNRACVRPSHLRLATAQQNQENRRGANKNNNSSGIRGVTWEKKYQMWRVQVIDKRHRHHGGYFRDLSVAEQAAIELRNSLFVYNERDRAKTAQAGAAA